MNTCFTALDILLCKFTRVKLYIQLLNFYISLLCSLFFLFLDYYHQYIPFCDIFFFYLFIDILNYASITVVLPVDWQKDTGVTHTLKD